MLVESVAAAPNAAPGFCRADCLRPGPTFANTIIREGNCCLSVVSSAPARLGHLATWLVPEVSVVVFTGESSLASLDSLEPAKFLGHERPPAYLLLLEVPPRCHTDSPRSTQGVTSKCISRASRAARGPLPGAGRLTQPDTCSDSGCVCASVCL